MDVKSLKLFLGLVNQLGTFAPDIAHMTEPICQLLRKDVTFTWFPDQDSAFQQVCSHRMVHYFDRKRPTELLTDTLCLNGHGFALTQRDAQGQIKLFQ